MQPVLNGVRPCDLAVCSNVEELFFPLMCVVDYLGLRLVCTSFIDGIGSGSLVYGSQDAGRTIHCSDPRMNHKVRLACEMKNLKGHNVLVSQSLLRRHQLAA